MVSSAFATSERGPGLRPRVERLMDRMVSPLCGLDKSASFGLRDGVLPRVQMVVPQLAAVHRLQEFPAPFSYHIGGYGLELEEAMMRALGETCERYVHMVLPLWQPQELEFTSYMELQRANVAAFSPQDIHPYTDEQLGREGFPFRPWSDTTPVSWITGYSPFDGQQVFVPAQTVVVGYRPRHADGEPWIVTAVTTGTAAHTDGRLALRSALAELIEVDTTMGYWYTGRSAPQIVLDTRTKHVQQLIEANGPKYGSRYTFHYLRNPDLAIHVVAAVVWSPEASLPAAGVGVACDFNLERAIYKSYLEATAIPQLSLIGLLQVWENPEAQALLRDEPNGNGFGRDSFNDLDLNVVYYALPRNVDVLRQRFLSADPIAASDLPEYRHHSADAQVRALLTTFRETGKRLLVFDFTTPDIEDLGFRVIRCYSPDTLPLSLPSYPHLAHPRYLAYGEPGDAIPHPYP
jgi:thiazole/oxazole-forming peptide maturase SagD family component